MFESGGMKFDDVFFDDRWLLALVGDSITVTSASEKTTKRRKETLSDHLKCIIPPSEKIFFLTKLLSVSDWEEREEGGTRDITDTTTHVGWDGGHTWKSILAAQQRQTRLTATPHTDVCSHIAVSDTPPDAPHDVLRPRDKSVSCVARMGTLQPRLHCGLRRQRPSLAPSSMMWLR